jgi:hypothetical protein
LSAICEILQEVDHGNEKSARHVWAIKQNKGTYRFRAFRIFISQTEKCPRKNSMIIR